MNIPDHTAFIISVVYLNKGFQLFFTKLEFWSYQATKQQQQS